MGEFHFMSDSGIIKNFQLHYSTYFDLGIAIAFPVHTKHNPETIDFCRGICTRLHGTIGGA
jgi:hypothetical protein